VTLFLALWITLGVITVLAAQEDREHIPLHDTWW